MRVTLARSVRPSVCLVARSSGRPSYHGPPTESIGFISPLSAGKVEQSIACCSARFLCRLLRTLLLLLRRLHRVVLSDLPAPLSLPLCPHARPVPRARSSNYSTKPKWPLCPCHPSHVYIGSFGITLGCSIRCRAAPRRAATARLACPAA